MIPTCIVVNFPRDHAISLRIINEKHGYEA